MKHLGMAAPTLWRHYSDNAIPDFYNMNGRGKLHLSRPGSMERVADAVGLA